MGKLNSLPIGVDFSSCLRRSGFCTLATSSKVLNDILWNRTEPVISWAKPQRFSAPSFQEVRHSCRKRCSLAWERSHFRKKMKEIHKKQMINMIIIDELCFLLSGPLYPCFAYATVYAMPTRPQWEPTRIIPLKVCKTIPQRTCLPTPWNLESELLLTRPQSHQHFAKWQCLRHPAGAPASRLQTAFCSAAAQAPRLQSAHRNLAATPAPRYQSAH